MQSASSSASRRASAPAAAVFYTATRRSESQFAGPDFAQPNTALTHATSDDVGGTGPPDARSGDVDSLAVAAQVRDDEADIFDDVNGPRRSPTSSPAASPPRTSTPFERRSRCWPA